MRTRPLAFLAAALFLAVLVPTSDAQDAKPDHCTPVSLSSFQEYSLQNVRAVWDGYTIDSKGVCIWEKSSPPNTMPTCRYGVQLAKAPFGWYANLCWWGTPTAPLRSTLTLSDVRRIVEELVGRPQVQDRLGPGQHVIQLDLGGETVTVVTRNGKVATIEGEVVPPAKCYTTYLGGYREYADPNVKKTWDEYSSDSIGVCRWDAPDRPTGDCNHMVEMGASQPGIPPFWLCWWGKLVSIASSHAALKPDITITMSRDAWLAVANADDPAATALWMAQNDYVVISADDALLQAALKAALNFGGERLGAAVQPPASDDAALFGPSGARSGFRLEQGPTIPTLEVSRSATWTVGPDGNVLLYEIHEHPAMAMMWQTPVRRIMGLGPSTPASDLQLLEPYPEPGTGAGWAAPPTVGPPESILDDVGEFFPPPESILDDVDTTPTRDQLRIMYDVGALVALQERHHEELRAQQEEQQDLTFPWYAGSVGVNVPLRDLQGSWQVQPSHLQSAPRFTGYYGSTTGALR